MSLTAFDISQSPSNQKNLLINGGFEIWQRGTSISSPANQQYTADRWKARTDHTPTYTVAQDSGTVDTGNFSGKVNITSVGSATALELEQDVEDFISYRGKTVTYSIRVWASVAGITCRLLDGVSTTESSQHPGDSAWHTLTVTQTLSGSASALNVQVGFISNTPVVTGFFVDSAMLVVSPTQATFVSPDPAEELMKCQRYYEKSYNLATSPGTNTSLGLTRAAGCHVVGSEVDIEIVFKVRKRANPSIVTYTPGGTSGQARWWAFNSATFEEVSTNANPVSEKGMVIFHTTTPDTYYAFADVHWTADAEI